MKAGHLSRGQRAGLCLALTLAPEPELLVLDDPALGLDPVARRSLLQSMLYVTRKADRTIFFSSHLLSDVERVADRIAVLDGKVLRSDCTVEMFRQQIRHFVLKFRDTPPPHPGFPRPAGKLPHGPRTGDHAGQRHHGDGKPAQSFGTCFDRTGGPDAGGCLYQLRGRARREDLFHERQGGKMRAMLWKELRENIKWALIAMIGLGLAEIYGSIISTR